MFTVTVTLSRLRAGVVLLVLALAFASAALTGWLVMLLLGALHSVWHQVPALGFWISLLIGIVLSAIFGGNRSS